MASPSCTVLTALEAILVLNLITKFGELDIVVRPSGTGYESLASHSLVVTVHGVDVPLAALRDVIASKQAANRPRDRQTLPTFRALNERLRNIEADEL